MKKSDYPFKSLYKKAVVKEIKDLRKQGATFREISDLLNKKDFQTLSDGGKWYPQSVHRLCK